MPKIFKKNKFALFCANLISIYVWILLSNFIFNLILGDNEPFYIYKLTNIVKILPPIWLTHYLWVVRGGFKRF